MGKKIQLVAASNRKWVMQVIEKVGGAGRNRTAE